MVSCSPLEQLTSYAIVVLDFLRQNSTSSEIDRLASVLADGPVDSAVEVFRRCQAADALAALGPEAASALPALRWSLVVPVQVDCALALRVAAARAVWKVSHQFDVALPILAWALKDEYWGLVLPAVEVLAEIRHAAVVPDLVHLAERRLANGPFHFEQFSASTMPDGARPLLSAVAHALGQCGQDCRGDQSSALNARTMLLRLAGHEDEAVRSEASKALAKVRESRIEDLP